MSEKKLHIVALDNPYPADYGGAIDMFYRIKALSEAGVGIILHVFYKNRKPGKEWEGICEKVYSYRRKTGLSGVSFKHPYIVYSRRSTKLLNNLLKDEFPILFEGLHTCFYLNHGLLQSRKKMVRLHNIEHGYYYNLYKNSNSILKRLYFRMESDLLCRFERILKHADVLFPISHKETKHFKAIHGKVIYMPPFADISPVRSHEQTENFCLYHGNLSVSENEQAVAYLVEQVFNNLEAKLVVAGKNPSRKIKVLCAQNPNIILVSNPEQQQLKNLLNKAKIHVLPSNQETGIKLKLLESLRYPGEVIISPQLNDEGMFSAVCHVAENPTQFQEKISELLSSESHHLLSHKTEFLVHHFDNKKNTTLILNQL